MRVGSAFILLFASASAFAEDALERLCAQAELARKEKREGEALTLFRGLLVIAPDHFETHVGYQRLLQSQGKEPELVAEYEALAEARPEPWALLLLGRVLHDPRREEGLYRQALEQAPAGFRLRRALADALERQLRREEAENEYREAIRLEPDDLEAHTSLMYLLDRQGKEEELLRTYREPAEKSPGDWRAQLLYGKALGITRDLEAAEERLALARGLAPEEKAPLFALATAHFKKNEWRRAHELLLNLRGQDAHDAKCLSMLGLVKLTLSEGAEGLQLLEEAARLEPGDSGMFALLGVGRLMGRDFAGAERVLLEAVRLDPSNANAVSSLGSLCMSRRQHAEAAKWFEGAIRLDARAPGHHIGLAEACEKLGLHERARREREVAAGLATTGDLRFNVSTRGTELVDAPLSKARELDALAQALVREGKLDAATSRFEASMRAAPGLDAPFWHLARVERRRGRLGEALAVYSRLRTLRACCLECTGPVLAAMAECRYDLGERREALDLWCAARDALPAGSVRRGHLEELIRRLEASASPGESLRLASLRIADCTQSKWCAPRSVAAVLSHWNLNMDLAEVAREMAAGEDGASFQAILASLAVRKDVTAACFTFRTALVKDLLKQGCPVILIWLVLDEGEYAGHASVVAGFDDALGVFFLEDSNWFAGLDRIAYAEAEAGKAILIAPPARFEAVAAALPDRPFWGLVHRGQELLDSDPERALAVLEEAVNLRGDEFLSHLSLGDALAAGGRLEAAVAAYERADALPGANAWVNVRMAAVLIERGEIDRAEDVLEAGRERAPGYAGVLSSLIHLAREKRQDPAMALRYCEEVIAAIPPSGKAYSLQGSLLMELGRRGEAIEAYTWAAHLDGPADAYWYLGHLQRDEGETRRAIAAFEKYRDLRQDKEGAAKVEELIDELRRAAGEEAR